MVINYEKMVCTRLGEAGIQINGPRPFDIQVHRREFYKRVFLDGSLGLGESYMDGWWDCAEIDSLIYRILRAGTHRRDMSKHLRMLHSLFFNLQSARRSFIIGQKHYDLGNALFENMLDSRMNYSCAYWKNADTLEQAQENKLDLICRKLFLKPGMRVLDIGCGWGSFGQYAARKYGVEVVGVTVSKEQVARGKELCRGLPVEFRLMDYRNLNERFDRIVSVGMFEHVGVKNYKTFFDVARRSLKKDGLFLLHTIGQGRSSHTVDPWIHKHIFPNGMLPSLAQISAASEDYFLIEDIHNFGTDYDRTLRAWYENFVSAWPDLQDNYSEQFYRMWEYYLLSCAASFRARKNQLWQIVLSGHGVSGGYESIR
ncbi:MAG: cyclopropane fatty acyl phospholipid synthase [Fibrobacterota bacterium]